MSERRQIVRSYQPQQAPRFDDQFWPIFMAMTITATILAATISTLLAGFWMWVSLMVLPAAIAMLLFGLRFVDNRRLRRSMQLAMILSLAAHCIFIISAHQLSVFNGFSLQVNRETAPVKPQRTIQISQQRDTQTWLTEEPTVAPTPYEPETERTAKVDTSTSKPQPSAIRSQKPSENPQLVRRQQVSQTVPRLGQQLSKLSRQSVNAQPRSSEKIEMASPAAKQPAAKSASMQAAASAELERRPNRESSSSSATSSKSKSSSQSQANARPSSESSQRRMASNESPASAARTAASASRSKRSQPKQPTRSEKAPTRVATKSKPATSRPVEAANLTRRSQPSMSPVDSKLRNQRSSSSPLEQMATKNQTSEAPRSTVAKNTPTRRISRSDNNQPQPTTPERIERPRPTTRVASKSGATKMQPKRMATERSSNGTAGVGRSANLNREVGARQSPSTMASDSMRRRERTSRSQDSALSQRQMAKVPRTAASQMKPSATLRADSLPVATRSASESPAKMTASASASLTQADSSSKRAETSVDKGTGSLDMGTTRIASDDPIRGVEGGGQPDIELRQQNEVTTRSGESSGSTPALFAEKIAPITNNSGSSNSTESTSFEPTPSATADMNSRSGGNQFDSGDPTRSTEPGESFANTDQVAMDSAALGRGESDKSMDDEDEEERRRREALAKSQGGGRSEASRQTDGPVGSTGDSPEIVAQSEGQGSEQGRGKSDARETALADATSGNGNSTLQRSSANSSGTGSGDARSRSSGQASNSRPDRMNKGTGQGNGDARRASNDRPSNEGPRVADAGKARSRSELTGVGPSDARDEAAPTMAGQIPNATGQANQAAPSDNIAAADRSATPGIQLQIDAKSGPAGVGAEAAPDPGVNSRQASRTSPAIQSMTETRFRSERSGGTPSISASPVIAKEAFRSRNNPSRSRSGPQTEEAIELGLAFLIRNQQEDGSWTLSGYDTQRANMKNMLSSDTAATALAILAFQGAGYNHKEFKYSRQLQAAIDWLVEQQQDTGELYISADKDSNASCRLYSHGIASLALCEAFGMTQDETIREPAQIALDYIADAQHKQGGWRYVPGRSSDTSVTGWMMMAMQSGRLAGLETNEDTWDGIEEWLTLAVVEAQPHLFRYDPFALDTVEKRHGRQASPCMTAVGLLMNVYLGWDRSDPRLKNGAQYLLEHLPDDSTITKRDTYYWYYATQILRHIGGESWETWHGALHPLLVESQIQQGEMAGSWHPLEPVPDRWGAQAGRLYVTTMNLLSLEVDYRLLPLHDDTVK